MGFTGFYIWQYTKIAWNWLPLTCQTGFVVFILILSINKTKTSIEVATTALSCRCRLNLNELCLMVTSTEGEWEEEGEEKTLKREKKITETAREGKECGRVYTSIQAHEYYIHWDRCFSHIFISVTIFVVSSNVLLVCCFPGTCVIWMAGRCCVSDALDLGRTGSPSVCSVLLLFHSVLLDSLISWVLC